MTRIGILGAGTMGQGIAQVAILAGFDVTLYDLSDDILMRSKERITASINKGIEKGKYSRSDGEGALRRLQSTHQLRELRADLIIEAVVEDLRIKQDLFNQIDNSEVILATNTSTIPITQIAAGVEHPERVVGIHFFNPAFIMPLVEVIQGPETSEAVVKQAMDLVSRMGKTAVKVKDSPGFIVNRVARHFYVESLKIIEERAASHEQVDTLLESVGFKMGPFKLMDLIGVDTNYLVTKNMYDQFHQEPKFRPSRIQQQLVEAGHTGRKSGKGFYVYDKK